MVSSYKATKEIEVITSNFPVPGYGMVPINAFVIRGSEPILVDTGSVVESREFMKTLRSVIDPAELKWIWLTHTDFDHIGSLAQLLAENPQIRLMTTFLSVGIMSLSAPLPLDKLRLVCPGQKITVGGRTLTVVRPPAFDNPATAGFYDHESGVLFSADCFGALLQDIPQSAADLSEKTLREGQVFWAAVDSPWLHKVDRNVFASDLEEIRKMQPKMILSGHLPAAPGNMMERLLESLAAVPAAQPFVGPDQAAFEQMLRKMTGAG